MPRTIALDWDAAELRVAVAEGATPGSALRLTELFSIPLPAVGDESTDLDSEDARRGRIEQIVEHLTPRLAERKLGRMSARFVWGRSGVEVRRIEVPPVPPEELPDLVRFAASTSFTGFRDDDGLDYFVTKRTETGLAAAVGAARLDGDAFDVVRTIGSRANLTPTHLTLRPVAAAELVFRAMPEAPVAVATEPNGDAVVATASPSATLILHRTPGEIHFTIVQAGEIQFFRTARLTRSERAEIEETRRTLLAAVGPAIGLRIGRIVLVGGADEEEHRVRLVEGLGREVERIDPMSAFGGTSVAIPSHVGRFAGVLGALFVSASADRPLDFLSPKRPPAPPNKRRTYALIATVATLLVAIPVGAYFWQSQSYAQQAGALSAEIALNSKAAEQAEGILSRRDLVRDWLDSEVVWLDEMANFSSQLPPPEEVVFRKFDATGAPWTARMATTRTGSEALATITLEGNAKSRTAVSDLRERIGGERYSVVADSTQTLPQSPPDLPGYTTLIKDSIRLFAYPPEELDRRNELPDDDFGPDSEAVDAATETPLTDSADEMASTAGSTPTEGGAMPDLPGSDDEPAMAATAPAQEPGTTPTPDDATDVRGGSDTPPGGDTANAASTNAPGPSPATTPTNPGTTRRRAIR